MSIGSADLQISCGGGGAYPQKKPIGFLPGRPSFYLTPQILPGNPALAAGVQPLEKSKRILRELGVLVRVISW